MPVQELFFSHSSKDEEIASGITQTLRDHGVPVWISTTNIKGAQQWHDEIGAALNRCDWFAVLLSKSSVESKWVKREVVYALRKDGYENRIIPTLLEDCDYESLSWTLGSLEIVDFRKSIEHGVTGLLKIWGIGLDKSKSTLFR